MTGFCKELERSDQSLPILREIQLALLANPEAGDLIPGCGGVRKFRVSDPSRSKGKRGGFRVIYLDLERTSKTYLIYLYTKGSKEDLDPHEKAIIRELVAMLKKETK